jgi:DNA segregation ATPase FtsK/SpoIIIE-like protein
LKQWNTPGGTAAAVCLDMLKQPHLLIAGSTGSGKSVLINSLIYTALYKSPNHCRFVLIDPKRVELIDYKPLPHTIAYASEPHNIAAALVSAVELMEQRYKRMQAARIKQSTEADIFIIIDEFADLMVTQKKQCLPLLIRLAQLGRAAHIHLIAATQRPTKDIVNGQIKVNMDSRVALRCPTGQDSRNIINIKGAESLPRYGYGYYLTPETMTPQLIQIPLTDPAELGARVRWWTDQNKTLLNWFYRPV